MGFPAARFLDKHVCPVHGGGLIVGPCVLSVWVGGMPVAVKGDKCICLGPPNEIVEGSSSVLAGNKKVARIKDKTKHVGAVLTGKLTVLVGE